MKKHKRIHEKRLKKNLIRRKCRWLRNITRHTSYIIKILKEDMTEESSWGRLEERILNQAAAEISFESYDDFKQETITG